MTLRQSLWHKVFGDAMVFREGAHILEFRQICEKRNTRLRNRLVRGGVHAVDAMMLG